MGTTGQSITLANSIIGVGILAMPFCFQQVSFFVLKYIFLSLLPGAMLRLLTAFFIVSYAHNFP